MVEPPKPKPLTEGDAQVLRGQIRAFQLRCSSMESENRELRKRLYTEEARSTALLAELHKHGWDYPAVEVEPEEKEQDDERPGTVESHQP